MVPTAATVEAADVGEDMEEARLADAGVDGATAGDDAVATAVAVVVDDAMTASAVSVPLNVCALLCALPAPLGAFGALTLREAPSHALRERRAADADMATPSRPLSCTK